MKKITARAMILGSIALLACLNPSTVAEDIYVNNACSVDGNGRGTTCASSAGGVGPFSDLQQAFDDSALGPGDTIHIMQGTGRYVSTNDSSYRVGSGGYHLARSGSASEWITVQAHAGDRPTISSFAEGQFDRSYACSGTSNANGTCTNDSECSGVCVGNNPAISLGGSTGYIRFVGFNIEGGLFTLGSAVVGNRPPIELDQMNIRYGFGDFSGGGNWSGVYIRQMDGLHIHNSQIHDIQTFGDNLTDAAIGLFYVENAIIENNVIGPVRGSSTSGNKNAGINDKICNPNLTVRYNHMVDLNAAMIVSGASNSCSDENGSVQNGGGRWYGNIVECRGQNEYGGTVVLGGPHVDGEIYNNTFDECRVPVQWSTGVNPFTLKFYNNIFSRTTQNNFGSGAPSGTGYADDLWDYNVFTPGRSYGIDPSLAARQSNRNVDLNSIEDTCSFVDLAARDYQITPGTTCAGFGRTNGVSSGSPLDAGAYGVTDCVGDTCDGSGGGGSNGGGGGGTTDPVGDVSGTPTRTDTKNQ